MPLLAALLLLFAVVDAGARGRVPPRKERVHSADGRYRVTLHSLPHRPVGRLQAVFAARPGGGDFGGVSTFTLVAPGMPEGLFLADGGKVFVTLSQPADPEHPSLAVYSLPTGRLMFGRKLRHMFDRAVLDSFAAPRGVRWATETSIKPRWSEGEVSGVTLQLPWGQELMLNFGNGYTWTTWVDHRLRPDDLDEEKAWTLFKSERSSATREGLIVYLGAHGSARSIAPLRELVDVGEFPILAAEALSRLAPEGEVLYRLLSEARSSAGRIAAGKALMARYMPNDARTPPALARALREATRKDSEPLVRQVLLDLYVHATWQHNPGLLAELRLAKKDEGNPGVMATYDRWIEFLTSK